MKSRHLHDVQRLIEIPEPIVVAFEWCGSCGAVRWVSGERSQPWTYPLMTASRGAGVGEDPSSEPLRETTFARPQRLKLIREKVDAHAAPVPSQAFPCPYVMSCGHVCTVTGEHWIHQCRCGIREHVHVPEGEG